VDGQGVCFDAVFDSIQIWNAMYLWLFYESEEIGGMLDQYISLVNCDPMKSRKGRECS
jgi:hypothetical protein